MATTLTGLLLKAGHQARAQDLFMMSHPAKVTIYTSVPKPKPPVREQAMAAILFPQVLRAPVSHGEGVGKLSVSILRRSGWVSTAKTVWSKIGSVNGGWHLARISLANSLTMQRYDVMFTGTVGNGANSGNIALDDITLINTGVC